jgi:hypothetical protein
MSEHALAQSIGSNTVTDLNAKLFLQNLILFYHELKKGGET